MRRALLVCLLAACGDDGGHINENELVTTVQLTFTSSGAPLVFEFDDPDGDGGTPGTSQPITLAAGTMYTLEVAFLNRLEMPAEDITLEVRDEGVDHQVFFTGTAVSGPATTNTNAPLAHAYADTDSNGLPIGLRNSITASAGTGELVVTLRHMPPELPPTKSACTAMTVAADGFSAIGGATDAQVTFMVTVQ